MMATVVEIYKSTSSNCTNT